MEHIRILIVEDNQEQSEHLSQMLENHGFYIAGVATNFQEAVEMFHHKDFDIIIIDIFLNGRPEGISFAEFVDVQPNGLKPFIFLTSATSRDIFNRAKLTKPFAYLIKPYNELELIYAIENAIEKFYGQDNSFTAEEENTVISQEHLFIKKGKSLKKVRTDEIVYIEVEEKYCNIMTVKEKFVILISLVKILELLDSSKFYRTHRNFIINILKIEEIIPKDNLVMLEGNYKATLSGKYKDEIISKFRTLK
ncbi:LytTR family two component transcriptional regulator [Kordia periserrulae]|uniref:LytTR family two component transcriptional regulator n=1 Tax=Kordia periserrulae TaxID=701523 RepID=A0A2T6C345_9FLAO|nr:response regulator transcription factor [Kordia periserrulae]PTX62746.1 LytTR family two component transcriptional regulator [Kordia periserrulae]